MRSAISTGLLALFTTTVVADWEAYGSKSSDKPTVASTTKVCKPKSTGSPVYGSSSVGSYSTYSPAPYGSSTVSTVTVVSTIYSTATGSASTGSASMTTGSETSTTTDAGSSTTTTSDDSSATTTSADESTTTTTTAEETPTTTAETTTEATTESTTTTSAAAATTTAASTGPSCPANLPAPQCSDPTSADPNAPPGVTCSGTGADPANLSCYCLATTCGQNVCVTAANFDCHANCESDSDCSSDGSSVCVQGLDCPGGQTNSCEPITTKDTCQNMAGGTKLFRVKVRARAGRSPLGNARALYL